jgi:hypothetical protein
VAMANPSLPSDTDARLASPLVLDARDELLFFKSAAHLEAYVEASDVANGEYGDCWDAEGRLLRLTVEARKATILGVVPLDKQVVRVQVAEEHPTHGGDLHLALLRHLESVCLAMEMPTSNDTTDLLQMALEHAGWS